MISLVRQPRWLALLAVTGVLCVLFWSLGAWQWDRHEDRVARNAAVAAALEADVEPLAEVVGSAEAQDAAEHRRVSVEGRYLTDAQTLQRNPSGRAGFAVITPLAVDAGGTLLVNRGFVPFSSTEPNQPADVAGLTPPSDHVQLIVRLRAPQPASGRTAPEGQIYDVDPRAYPYELPAPVYPMSGDLVEQDPATPTALELPPPVDLGMGPHLFYAIQWWLFIPISLIGLTLLLRRESGQQRDTPDAGPDQEQSPVARRR